MSSHDSRSSRLRLAVGAGVAVTGLLLAAPTGAAFASRRPTPGVKPVFASSRLAGASGSAEPRVAVTRAGVRYVATNATQGTEIVYRSSDGLQWERTTGVPVGQTLPTTDVDIVALPAGRLVTTELDYAGINFITSYSDDGGRSWTASRGTTFADTDRPWLAAGPVDPSTHEPYVYLLFHDLVSGTVQHNMFVSTSTDGGATFGVPTPITLPPSQAYLDLQCADSGGPSNIVVSPRGDMVYAVFGTRSSPIGGCAAQPVEVNVVAANRVWVVGAPTGRTTDPTAWKASLAVDDTAAGRIVGMQLAPGAVDTAGNVWVAYPESVKNYPDYNGAAIKLVHAAPGLAHWSRPILIAASGGAGHILPHLVAGAPGRIDLAYYTGVGTGPATIWYSDAAQVLDGLSARPLITRVQLSAVPVERGTASSLMGACLSGPAATLNGFTCGRSADVYGIALDGCGRLVVTWPAQAGFAGTDGTYVSQQTGGPTLLATRCTGGRW